MSDLWGEAAWLMCFHPALPISIIQNRRVSQMRALLAAYNTLTQVLYVFEHKT